MSLKVIKAGRAGSMDLLTRFGQKTNFALSMTRLPSQVNAVNGRLHGLITSLLNRQARTVSVRAIGPLYKTLELHPWKL
jgi:hypothetical protein